MAVPGAFHETRSLSSHAPSALLCHGVTRNSMRTTSRATTDYLICICIGDPLPLFLSRPLPEWVPPWRRANCSRVPRQARTVLMYGGTAAVRVTDSRLAHGCRQTTSDPGATHGHPRWIHVQ